MKKKSKWRKEIVQPKEERSIRQTGISIYLPTDRKTYRQLGTQIYRRIVICEREILMDRKTVWQTGRQSCRKIEQEDSMAEKSDRKTVLQKNRTERQSGKKIWQEDSLAEKSDRKTGWLINQTGRQSGRKIRQEARKIRQEDWPAEQEKKTRCQKTIVNLVFQYTVIFLCCVVHISSVPIYYTIPLFDVVNITFK